MPADDFIRSGGQCAYKSGLNQSSKPTIFHKFPFCAHFVYINDLLEYYSGANTWIRVCVCVIDSHHSESTLFIMWNDAMNFRYLCIWLVQIIEYVIWSINCIQLKQNDLFMPFKAVLKSLSFFSAWTNPPLHKECLLSTHRALVAKYPFHSWYADIPTNIIASASGDTNAERTMMIGIRMQINSIDSSSARRASHC